MDRSLIATSNAATFTECVLELVSNSLNANATAIAIRIHADKRKIQIVDNGIGISKKELETVAEYESKNSDCCKTQCVCDSQKTLVNIRRLCDAMLITSRYYNSSKTYMKVFKVWCAPKIVKVHRRPSQGTTVTIYGFHELSLNKWNIFSMHHLIATIAIINIQASFSIRDDQEKRIIMVASKSRSPIKSIHLLYNKEISFTNLWCVKHTRTSDINFHAYVALTKSYATQYIFLNNKPVYCPVILHMISSTFIALWHFFGKVQSKQILKPEAVFILLFIRSTQYIFSVEKGKRILILTSTQDLLHIIRSEIVNIFIKNIMPLPNSVAKYIRNHKNVMYNRLNTLNSIQIFKKTPMLLQPCASNKIEREMITNQLNLTQISCVVSQSFTSVSQNTNVIDEHHTPTLSEWSNWTYPELDDLYNPKKIQSVSKKRNFDRDSLNFYKRFNFLPEKLHKLLRGKAKLTKTNILNELSGSILSVKLKSGLEISDTLLHEEMDVRACKSVQRFHEFRLKKELVKTIKVLGQMNNELIVGLIIEGNMKVLVLIDQHAIHERIRYEDLLYKYKSQTGNELHCIKLIEPISIDLPIDKRNLLLSYKIQFKQFGISLSSINDKTVIVHTVPECLKRNKYYWNEMKLKSSVQSLINELLQSIINNEHLEINDLPLTIHSAIAMEACHGAIKFGDPLTLHQCKQLLKLLNKTKIPTRCAHGRPSIIPLLELSQLVNRHRKIVQVCNCNT